jgi:hypothetical protein
MDDGVDALEGGAGAFVEAVDEAALVGLEEARGVDEDDLGAGVGDDAVDGVAGGLGFGSDDGDLGAD